MLTERFSYVKNLLFSSHIVDEVFLWPTWASTPCFVVLNCCLAPVCPLHNASLGCKTPTCYLSGLGHGHSLSCICEDKTLLFVSNQVSRFLLKKKTLHIRWSRDFLTLWNLWNPSSFINISPAAGENSTTRSIVYYYVIPLSLPLNTVWTASSVFTLLCLNLTLILVCKYLCLIFYFCYETAQCQPQISMSNLVTSCCFCRCVPHSYAHLQNLISCFLIEKAKIKKHFFSQCDYFAVLTKQISFQVGLGTKLLIKRWGCFQLWWMTSTSVFIFVKNILSPALGAFSPPAFLMRINALLFPAANSTHTHNLRVCLDIRT